MTPKEQAKTALDLMSKPRRERRRIMKLNPGMRIPGVNVPYVKPRRVPLHELRP